jgi:CRISPR-associated protein Cas1
MRQSATRVARRRGRRARWGGYWHRLSPGRRYRAWTQVRDNAYEDGEPGPGVLAFEHHALKALADLADALADGSYEPRPMTSLTIAKSAGGSRRIAVGAIEDRIVERAVLDVLDPLIG